VSRVARAIQEPVACDRDLPAIRCVAEPGRSSTCLWTRLRCGPVRRLAS